MLDLKFLRSNLDLVRQALKNRNSNLDLDVFLSMDERRRALLQEAEALKGERNQASAEVAKRKRAGEDAGEIIERMAEVNQRIKELDEELAGVDASVQDWLMGCPNVPHESTPVGRDESDNVEVRVWGERRHFEFTPKEHWEIGAELGGLDFERAAKLTGSRFAVSWGWAARLERGLIQLMLDLQTGENGYLEVLPPFIVNTESLKGTGQLPKFAGDLFKLEGWDYWLIPTAEVPVTNLHRDEVLEEASLPRAYAAYTPCFRSEAGSYGKDVKGLIRQHQFDKIELVRFTRPEESMQELEQLTGHAESVLRKLGIPYRVVALSTGDLGFSSAKTYDIEVWLPGQNKYREISSCSNFLDFQARRANIRYRPKGGNKTQLVHTLNGSGLAVGRTVVAILENFQQADGSVAIPDALQPYMGGRQLITPDDRPF